MASVTSAEPGSVGLVETRRGVLFTEDDPLVLASGATLGPVEVAYETYGELNAAGTNAVFVCHALTGDAHAAGHHGDPARPGWWDTLIGPGKPLDTERVFVVSANLLGGCQGTTGPSSPDPRTGRPYALRFPLPQVRDLVTVHRALLRRLGVGRLLAAIGGSLGGMQVLQWALDHPEDLHSGLVIAASARLTTQNIAFSAESLTVPAAAPFELRFDNLEAAPHNVAIFQGADATAPNVFREAPFAGPKEVVYMVPALEAGSYYFHCDVHPNMKGTLNAQ